jgi:hypothetical protein
MSDTPLDPQKMTALRFLVNITAEAVRKKVAERPADAPDSICTLVNERAVYYPEYGGLAVVIGVLNAGERPEQMIGVAAQAGRQSGLDGMDLLPSDVPVALQIKSVENWDSIFPAWIAPHAVAIGTMFFTPRRRCCELLATHMSSKRLHVIARFQMLRSGFIDANVGVVNVSEFKPSDL